jgi:hypothetical protein
MTDTIFNPTEVQLVSASNVESSILSEYYSRTFPHRRQSLPLIWRWLNKSESFNDNMPFVLLYQTQVIGHVGLRPVKLKINGKPYEGGWPIDLRVNEEYRKYGLGKLLTKKFTEYAEIHLGFLNENSYPLFTRLGWKDGCKTYTHFIPINPFDHPKFHRSVPSSILNVGNIVLKPFLTIQLRKFRKIKYKTGNVSKIEIDGFVSLREKYHNKIVDSVVPQRDLDFLNWRILKSPNLRKYKLFSIMALQAIILENDNRGKYIDILTISDYSDVNKVIELIGSIAYYASKNNFSYVRFCSSDAEFDKLMSHQLKTTKKKYNLCFYTADKGIEPELEKIAWHWELIDSDFEYMEPKQ